MCSQPLPRSHQATRQGTAAHAQHAAAMAERPRDPVWAEWGRKRRAGTACDCLNISARSTSTTGTTCCSTRRQQVGRMAVQERRSRSWCACGLALWRMRTALPTITGASPLPVDLADDLSELDRVGGRINANPPAAAAPMAGISTSKVRSGREGSKEAERKDLGRKLTEDRQRHRRREGRDRGEGKIIESSTGGKVEGAEVVISFLLSKTEKSAPLRRPIPCAYFERPA